MQYLTCKEQICMQYVLWWGTFYMWHIIRFNKINLPSSRSWRRKYEFEKGKQAPLGMRWGQIYSIGIVYMQSLSRWGIDKHAITVLGTYMRRLNFEEFRKFLCAKILYLWPRHIKSHTENWLKLLKLFRIFLNIHNLFDFFEVFYTKLCNHVLCTIRFAIKFHIELRMSGDCETLWEDAITCFIGFTRVEIA